MNKIEQLYEGKAKKVYSTEDPNVVIVSYKDDATAFDGWIDNPQDFDLAKLSGTSDMKKVKDLKDRPLLLFVNEWSIRMTQERNDGLVLTEFAR